MKRDIELLRTIVQEIERTPAGERLEASAMRLPDWDAHTVAEHIRLLSEANFISVVAASAASPGGPKRYLIHGLTWEGHDFCDAVRNDDVWNQVKRSLGKIGGTAGIDVVKSLASSIAKATLGIP